MYQTDEEHPRQAADVSENGEGEEGVVALGLFTVSVPVHRPVEHLQQVGATHARISLYTVAELAMRLAPPERADWRHNKPTMSAPSVWKSWRSVVQAHAGVVALDPLVPYVPEEAPSGVLADRCPKLHPQGLRRPRGRETAAPPLAVVAGGSPLHQCRRGSSEAASRPEREPEARQAPWSATVCHPANDLSEKVHVWITSRLPQVRAKIHLGFVPSTLMARHLGCPRRQGGGPELRGMAGTGVGAARLGRNQCRRR